MSSINNRGDPKMFTYSRIVSLICIFLMPLHYIYGKKEEKKDFIYIQNKLRYPMNLKTTFKNGRYQENHIQANDGTIKIANNIQSIAIFVITDKTKGVEHQPTSSIDLTALNMPNQGYLYIESAFQPAIHANTIMLYVHAPRSNPRFERNIEIK